MYLVLVLGQKRKYENKSGEIFFKLQHVRLTQHHLQKIHSSSTDTIHRGLEASRGKFRPFLQRTPDTPPSKPFANMLYTNSKWLLGACSSFACIGQMGSVVTFVVLISVRVIIFILLKFCFLVASY